MTERAMNNIPANDPLRVIIEEVWANLREVSERQKETSIEMNRLAEEAAERRKEDAERRKEADKRREETDREMKRLSQEADKRQKEADRIVRRNSKQMGDLHRRFGELAEHLVAPNIHKRFNELGYHFDGCLPGGMKIFDKQGNTKTEIDLVMENGSTLMALEVKTRPTVKDVEHHIKRLEILRDHRRSRNDNRTIKGAIAGAIFGAEEKKATIEAGLYVVEQSGDTMKIDVPLGFVAREW
jgi:hypothetical protein